MAQLAGQQRREGIDALVIALYHNEILAQLIEHNKVPYNTTGVHSAFDVRAWIRLAIVVKKITPDILHFHMTLFWNLFILGLPWMKKCPWVYHARGFSPGDMTLKDRLTRLMLCSRIDAVVGISEAVTRDMKKYLGPGIPIYRTIYNGLYLADATDVLQDGQDAKKKEAQGRPLIGMATRFGQDKGIKEFIEAIPYIFRLLPGARFVLAGEGPFLARARELCASLGVDKIISFPGFINNISQFWSNLDFALFTAPREAFGLRIIEPQACGTVVVGYLSGAGSDEIILTGQTGMLVTWGDRERLAREIAALWSDPARYKKMAAAARTRLEKEFSIGKTARRCIELYQELL